MERRSFRLSSLLILVVVFGGLLLAWARRDAVYDWLRLYHYQPPASIVQLAGQTTMTPSAIHLLYINHPVIEDKASFNQNCPNNGGEQTIVLGCYHNHETGIFLYNVSDPELDGVEQVTAAHEMLHAAYERLSTSERNYVDGLLENYYQQDLHDQRLLATIAAYKKTEPNDVVNEMHSVFGTEVVNLPPALEAYYKQYFTDRQKVAAYAQQYQSAFTSRKDQVDADDAKLTSLKQQIDNLETSLGQQENTLSAESAQLDQQQASGGNFANYQAAVNSYNQQVVSYQGQVKQIKDLIAEYNQLVNDRNDLAVQEQNLYQALNSNPTAESTR